MDTNQLGRDAARAAAAPGRLLARWLAGNPVLTLALVALLILYGLPLVSSGLGDGFAGLIWAGAIFVLRPFSLIATWVDPYLRGFPEFVDWFGTLSSGLLPYVVADVIYRRFILLLRGGPAALHHFGVVRARGHARR
jgi:hypothetical protein